MIRTKKKQGKQALVNPVDEPLVVSKHTMDLLLASKNFPELLALYLFYYYTGKWQGTDRPKATTEYVAKGLHWKPEKVRKCKKQLLALGLVDDLVETDHDTGQIIGWYIKVNFYWGNNTLQNPPYPQNQRVGFGGGKCLLANKENKKEKFKKEKSLVDEIVDQLPNSWSTNEPFKEALGDWIENRKQKRAPITQVVIRRFIAKCNKTPIEVMTKALAKAADNGYTGYFIDNERQNKTMTNNGFKGKTKFKDYDKCED